MFGRIEGVCRGVRVIAQMIVLRQFPEKRLSSQKEQLNKSIIGEHECPDSHYDFEEEPVGYFKAMIERVYFA